MKRFCLLLALLMLAAPACAESLSVQDRYDRCVIPESVVLMEVQTEDGTVYLVRNRDGSRHLECWGKAAPVTPVTSSPLPPDALLAADSFGEPVVIFAAADGGTVTAMIRRDGDVWRIRELAEDYGYRWMYAGGGAHHRGYGRRHRRAGLRNGYHEGGLAGAPCQL